MKILCTGSNGFVGKNLCLRLEQEGYDVIRYDIGDQLDTNVDFIFHFAGVNRPSDDDFSANWTILEQIIKSAKCPIMLSSSIQAELDNDYGRSKLRAEQLLDNYKYDHFVYRFTNIFGKWCRPSYNSVIATWCYNKVHNKDLLINDPNKLVEFIYIDDLCDEMIKLLKTRKQHKIVSYKVTLGDLAKKIEQISDEVKHNVMPDFKDQFYKKLFSTYLSYIENPVNEVEMHIDNRGSFTEVFKSINNGMISVNVMKPGITKGNHYHNSKWEYFVVIKGSATIVEEDVITHNTFNINVDDSMFKPVLMLPGYNHKIINTSNEDTIFIIYANELFDKSKPDTFNIV